MERLALRFGEGGLKSSHRPAFQGQLARVWGDFWASLITVIGPLHKRDWVPVTITLQVLSLVEKTEPVQVLFTLCSRDQQHMWMQDGFKVYMDFYMVSNGSCFIVAWIILKKYLLKVGLTQNQNTMALWSFTSTIRWMWATLNSNPREFVPPTLMRQSNVVTNELDELEKWLVKVQDFKRTTDPPRGIYKIHPKLVKRKRKITTCNRLDLETLRVTSHMSQELWPWNCESP